MTAFCSHHCAACGSHFTSLGAFDAHRSGPFDGERVCSFPDDAPLVELTGSCRICGPTLAGVTLYEHADANRLREYRRGRNGRGRENGGKTAQAAETERKQGVVT